MAVEARQGGGSHAQRCVAVDQLHEEPIALAAHEFDLHAVADDHALHLVDVKVCE